MTAFDYGSAARTAERLIRKFGAVGAIRREAAGSGPKHNPGPPVVTDFPAHVVATSYAKRDIDGQRILASDIKLLVEPTVGVEPTTTDKAVVNGAAYPILDVRILRPATTTVLYEVQCRR